MTRNVPTYILAAAIVTVGLVLAGLPGDALLLALLIGGCALMMFVVMRGMYGDDDRHDRDNSTHTHR